MILRKILRNLTLVPKEARASYQKEFQWYPGAATWSVRVYDRVLRRGPRLPLPARKRITRLCFKGMDHPFYVRLGSSDLQLHQTIRFRGEYLPVKERTLKNIRQVVDLGSNAGFTIRLWREMFPAARIIGVEPDPENFRICRLNADSIPNGRVDLVQACVDGKPGSVFLDRSESEHRFKMADSASANTIEVQALTVPQILEQVKADSEIGMLKCDIQGAEQAVFAACSSWISQVRNMIVEVHPPYTGEHLMHDLTKNGWSWKELVTHKTDNLWVLFFWNDR